MEPQLDIKPKPRASSRDQATRLRRDFPDFYDDPCRGMPPMISAGIAFGIAAMAFFGAESILPDAYKPSRWIGTYETAIGSAQAKGRAEGELAVRIEYDKKLKLLEASANMIVETCKAQLSRSNDLYKVIWDRANTGYRLYGEQRNANAAQRNRLAENTTGASQQVVSLAELFGYGGMLLGENDFAQKSFDFAQMARQRAYDVVETAQSRGVEVSEQNWDFALPNPDSLAPVTGCNPTQSVASSGNQG